MYEYQGSANNEVIVFVFLMDIHEMKENLVPCAEFTIHLCSDFSEMLHKLAFLDELCSLLHFF